MEDEQNLNGSDTENNSQTGQENNFSIPEEYAQKDWVKNFEGQSGDDLKANVFKALDEKYTNIPIIPNSPEEYNFSEAFTDENGNAKVECNEEIVEFFGNEFKDLGLTKEQGQGILKKYADFEVAQFEKLTNAEDLEKSVSTLFNGDTKQRNIVEGLLKETLSKEDQKFLQESTPNAVIEIFYKLAKGVVDKYGLKEGTQNSNNTNSNSMRMSKEDKDAEYNKIVSEMEELKKRPHSPEERQRLQNKLIELYK